MIHCYRLTLFPDLYSVLYYLIIFGLLLTDFSSSFLLKFPRKRLLAIILKKHPSLAIPACSLDAIIDYSAANEYVRSHYNQSRYFGDKEDKTFECIYDARELQSCYENEKVMLEDNGFALLKSPLKQHNDLNLSDLKEIEKSILPELEKIISSLFPSKVLMHCFWNPMIRGESYEISRNELDDNKKTPTANIASMSHIDTDVGAYESIHDLLGMIAKNKVGRSLETTTTEYDDKIKDLADAIIDGKKRFAILNFWRNIANTPVVRAPLSILSTRYSNNVSDTSIAAFPDAIPDMDESKWYVFPNITRDEVIVFYQYDRVISQPSDLWHCAVSIQHTDGIDREYDLPPRKSFDIRALIVLDENVPLELDRFTPDRSRPILSFEESECFCDEQAEMRNISNT